MSLPGIADATGGRISRKAPHARTSVAILAFDFIVCRSALQNFPRPAMALSEMRRVLKPGGRAVVVELRNDVSSRALSAHVRKVSRGLLEPLLNRLVFRLVLVRRAYEKDRLLTLITGAGFRVCDVRRDQIYIEVWFQKPVA